MRETVKDLLVVDSGDLLFKKFIVPVSGDEVRTATEKAQFIIEAFNLMGYGALGIGDDDLSLGKNFLIEISRKANFPFLSGNLFDEESGRLLFQPYLVKEVNGLRVGIFSLLSPDFFDPADPRTKGLIIKPPSEVAESMVKELRPKTDLIILLSHLGYPKDVELAQALPGIQIIVGSHSGISLANPPVIKNTVILQTPSKGMYVGRLDLSLINNASSFYNMTTKQLIEKNLSDIKDRLATANAPETEKARWRMSKEGFEKQLHEFQGKNEFSNTLLPLTEQMRDHPDVGKRAEALKPGVSETAK